MNKVDSELIQVTFTTHTEGWSELKFYWFEPSSSIKIVFCYVLKYFTKIDSCAYRISLSKRTFARKPVLEKITTADSYSKS